MASLYRHFDADGRLLYVGISLSSIKRLAWHIKNSSWCEDIRTITIEPFPTKALARLAEAAAIKNENPLFNKHHVVGYRHPITFTEKWERARLLIRNGLEGGMTYGQIAIQVGVSRQRVHQIAKRMGIA